MEPGKTEKYTKEDVVGFKLEAKTESWDTPRRSKLKFIYTKQKVNECALWVYRNRWLEKAGKKRGFVFKYEKYQYYDFVAYFMTLTLLKILQEDIPFSMPYRLGTIKLIHFKNARYKRNGKLELNLHSLRMQYRFMWYSGGIPSMKAYKFHKSDYIKWAIFNRLKFKNPTINHFFHFIEVKRHGAWVGAPDRDYDKLQLIIDKNYGIPVFRPDIGRLDRRQRRIARKRLQKSAKEVGN